MHTQRTGYTPGQLILDGILAVFIVAFIAALLFAMMREQGFTNSYAALADAFLNGQLNVERCFDVDCAVSPDGRSWVIFPPFPALVSLPFVMIFGVEFSGFIPLAMVFVAISALLWVRIFRSQNVEMREAMWLTIALVFASPVYLLLLRANGIWFFAQAVSFLLVTLSIYEAFHKKRLVLIGVFIGLAFLTRQMSVFYAPFILVLLLESKQPVWRINRDLITKIFWIGLPIALSIGVYFVYNNIRFGDFLENGYRYLIESSDELVPGEPITNRLNTVGLFSKDYALFNFVYMFFQGFHFEFTGPNALTSVGMDRWGTSLFAASPFVFLALLAPFRQENFVGYVVILLIAGVTIFYHSNGYSQINAQRYTLDWLPILMVFVARAVTKARMEVVRLLILYALVLNLGAFALTAWVDMTA